MGLISGISVGICDELMCQDPCDALYLYSLLTFFPFLLLVAPCYIPNACRCKDKAILTLCRRPRVITSMHLLNFLHLAA